MVAADGKKVVPSAKISKPNSYVMKQVLSTLVFLFTVLSINAQSVFKGKYYNDEHEIFLVINFYDKDITIPGQEIYGHLDGYIGSKRTSLVWMITSSEIHSAQKASIEVVNDYGSEDADAILIQKDENTLEYTRKKGSNLRFSKNGKWVRIPSKILFKRK